MQAAIQIRGVSYRYQEHQALDGINLEIPAGKIFALLGPNGGGKSTLLKLVGTLLAPQGGSILIEGESVCASLGALRQKLGIVFQSPSLDKKLTVLENLRYHAAFYGLSAREVGPKIEEGLQRFNLTARKHELVEKLSGGLQRRVELAKVLLSSPKILLLDEPTTGLDPGVRMTLWEDLRKLQEQQKLTILFTTHLMEEAEMADQVALLDQGHVVGAGTPAGLKAEIGADLLRIQVRSHQDTAPIIQALEKRYPAFHVEPRIYHNEVLARVAKEDSRAAREQMIALANEFADSIESITLSRPTMADVYFSKTGKWLQAGARL